MATAKSAQISSAMVAAGVRVLRASGFLWSESLGDALVVRQILEAALAAPEWKRSSSATTTRARRTPHAMSDHSSSDATVSPEIVEAGLRALDWMGEVSSEYLVTEVYRAMWIAHTRS